MKKIKNIKEKIENNIVFRLIKWIIYIVVVLLLIIIIVQKVTNNNLSIGGFRIFMIVSESMKDEYDIGDVLVSKSVPSNEINVGDNITYLGEEGALRGLIITHKVVNKDEREGEVFFTTKGLANYVEDPEISYDQVYGKVIYKFVLLSALAKMMNNQLSYYIIFVLVAMIISIEVMSSMFHTEEDEEEGDGDRGD